MRWFWEPNPIMEPYLEPLGLTSKWIGPRFVWLALGIGRFLCVHFVSKDRSRSRSTVQKIREGPRSHQKSTYLAQSLIDMP